MVISITGGDVESKGTGMPDDELALPRLRPGGSGARVRFGPFELDRAAGQLFRKGHRVKLPPQPAAMLIALVNKAGQEVTREELAALWPAGTFVDFDAGIASCVRKIRVALGDDAENPMFVKTLHGRGFCFISAVQYVLPEAPEAPATERPYAMPAPSRTAPAEPPEHHLEVVALPAARKGRAWRIALACGATVALAAAVVAWRWAYPAPPVLDRLRPFANAHGRPSRPAFSPNGEMVAFDWRSPTDQHTCIYVQRLDDASAVKLTPGASEELRPAWSHDGSRVAFLRNISANQFAILTVPLVGKGERVWTQFQKGATPWLDWSGDGKWFAFATAASPDHPPSIVILSLETGERRVLTNPPVGWRGDSEPAFSPDSSRVAFRRTTPVSGVEDIYTVPLTGGEPTRITSDGRTISAMTFTPDGGLLFSSARFATNRSLWWRAPGGGSLQRVTTATVDAVAPTASRDGKHFALTKILLDLNVWRVNSDGSGAAAPVIASELPDSGPDFSPDGRRILFQSSRTGTDDIWVCDANGADAVRLTNGGGLPIGSPKWSPDGRQIAYDWRRSGKSNIYLMAADGGNTRTLVADGSDNNVPAWSRDGRWLYFGSNRTGRAEIWISPLEGGPAVQITRSGGSAPKLSPDGTFLFYFREASVWRVPLRDNLPSGPDSKVLAMVEPVGDWGNWTPANDGLYYVRRKPEGGTAIEFLDFARRGVRTVYEMPRPPVFAGNGLALSPDGKTLLFVEVDQDESSIFVQ